MDKNRVLDALHTLQAELAGADRVDEPARAALEQITLDIERLLEKNEGLSPDDSDTLAERLQDAVLEFETEHPQLTGAVNQVAAALANLGI